MREDIEEKHSSNTVQGEEEEEGEEEEGEEEEEEEEGEEEEVEMKRDGKNNEI